MIIPEIHLIFDLIFDLILFNFRFNFHIGTTPRLAGAQPLEQPSDIEKLPASGAQQPVQMDAALDSETYANLLRHFDTMDVADLQQTLCSRTSQVPDSAASSLVERFDIEPFSDFSAK